MQASYADRSHPEWQDLQLSDQVKMRPGSFGPASYQVAQLTPNKSVVLGHQDKGKWVDTWELILFQSLTALIFYLADNPHAWSESARWRVLTIIPANLVGIILLVRLFKAEGRRYFDILHFSKASLGKDLLWLLVTMAIGLPIAVVPINGLAALIFGNATTPTGMLVHSLPVWILAMGLLFPLTIAFSELPIYFGYVMPRLAYHGVLPGLATLLFTSDSGWAFHALATHHVPAFCAILRLAHQAAPEPAALFCCNPRFDGPIDPGGLPHEMKGS